MIVTMTVVRMVKASVNQIVGVVAVRDCLVPAARPVGMTSADVVWRAVRRVGSVNWYRVLVDMIAMHVMEMAFVQVVNVAFVLNSRVATTRAMLMGMIGVFLQCKPSWICLAHEYLPSAASNHLARNAHLRESSITSLSASVGCVKLDRI